MPKELPFEGGAMYQCLLKPFDFTTTYVVVVSGDGPNFCGHALLRTGGDWYFHIAKVYDVPRFMREAGYHRYLNDHGKRELRRTSLKIPDPAGAHRKLEELLAKQWAWFIFPHNCASFIEDVVQAGGSKAGLYFNCPAWETFR